MAFGSYSVSFVFLLNVVTAQKSHICEPPYCGENWDDQESWTAAFCLDDEWRSDCTWEIYCDESRSTYNGERCVCNPWFILPDCTEYCHDAWGDGHWTQMSIEEWATNPDYPRKWDGPSRCDWNFPCNEEGYEWKDYPDPGMIAAGYDNCRCHCSDTTMTGEGCETLKQWHSLCGISGCKGESREPSACIDCIEHSHMDESGSCVCDDNYGANNEEKEYQSDWQTYLGPCYGKCTSCSGPGASQCRECEFPDAQLNKSYYSLDGVCECEEPVVGEGCQTPADIIYVSSYNPEGENLGDVNSPYVDLIYALFYIDVYADEGSGFRIFLAPVPGEDIVLQHGNIAEAVSPLEEIPSHITDIHISPAYCDINYVIPNWVANRSEKVRISYKNPFIRLKLKTGVRLEIENVIFTSGELFVDGCTEHWCQHCHDPYSLLLDQGEYYTPHGTVITTDASTWGDCLWNNIKDYDLHNTLDWYLFSVEHSTAVLVISNSKFENWRFRQKSVINIYEGEVKLENVDFENTESSYRSMEYNSQFNVDDGVELGYSSNIFAVPGIITATKINRECTRSQYHANFVQPCGKFSWIGGSVTGHNIDMNPFQDSDGDKFSEINERFNPFLNLNRLSDVHISGITVSKNFMIATLDFAPWTPSLFTIQFCEQVSLDNITFVDNWVSSGAISIFLAKKFLPWDGYWDCVDLQECENWQYEEQNPFDLVFYELKNLTFTGNKSGLNGPFKGLINVKAESWVSINLENIAVQHHDFKTDSFIFNLMGYDRSDAWGDVWVDEDRDKIPDIRSPITVKLDDINLVNNFGGSLINAQYVPSIILSNSEFISNRDLVADNDYAWKFEDWSNQFSSWDPQWYNGLWQAWSTGCYHLLYLNYMWSINFENVQIDNNLCSYGVIIDALNIERDIVFTNVNLDWNTFSILQGGAVRVNPTTTQQDKMPVLDTCRFSYNVNLNELGAGAFALYELYSYGNNPVTLTVRDCSFDYNQGGASGAIGWEGVNLFIENTSFVGNIIKYGAAISFSQYQLNPQISTSTVLISSWTFTSNTSKSSVSNLAITERSSYIQLQLQITDSIFSETSWSSGWAGIRIEEVRLAESVINNTQFLNSSANQILFNPQLGTLQIQSWTFQNIVSIDDTAFILIRGTFKEEIDMTINIQDSIFTDNTGRYGIQCEQSAFATLTTDRCEITRNDMQFIYAANTNYEDTLSQFVFNEARTYSGHASYFEMIQGSIALLQNTTVTDNYAINKVGVIQISDEDSVLNIEHVSFQRNSAGNSTSNSRQIGVIEVLDSAKIQINSTTFEENAGYDGVALRLLSTTRKNIVKDCTFSKNKGQVLISVESSELIVENSVFDNNIDDDTSAIYLTSSKLYSSENVFKNYLWSRNWHLEIYHFSTVRDYGSIFRDSRAIEFAAIAYFDNSNGFFNGSQFINNGANQSGNIATVSVSELTLQDVKFDGCYSSKPAAWIKSESSRLIQITNTEFSNFNNTAVMISNNVGSTNISNSLFRAGGTKEYEGGAIHILDSNPVVLDNVIFEGVNSSKGGAIHIGNESGQIQISNSRFTGCSATTGGAIYASKGMTLSIIQSEFFNNFVTTGEEKDTNSDTSCLCEEIEISKDNLDNANLIGGAICANLLSYPSDIVDCLFMNNTAQSGGAISVNGKLYISRTTFQQNKAKHFGGGIYSACSTDDCDLEIYESSFINNTVELFAGGGLYWEQPPPILTNLTFSENYAIIGPDISSIGSSVNRINNRRATEGLESLSSGQQSDLVIAYEIVDNYGQRVVWNNVSQGQISSTGQLDNNHLTTAINGVLSFSNFTVTSNPDSNVTLSFEIDLYEVQGEASQVSTDSIELYVKPWDYGEILIPNGACYVCDENEFSIKKGDTKCEDCPDEAVCLGGIQVFPKKNYWRSGWDSTNFYSCRILEVWLGGEETKNYSGECLNGYQGRLWTVCDDTWARVGKYNCTECLPHNEPYFILIAFYVMFLFGFSLFVLKGNIEDAEQNQTAYSSVLLRILANHIQVLAIVQSLRLDWPDIVLQYYDSQDKVGSSSEIALNLDCIIDRDLIDPVYANLIWISIMPFDLALITVLIFLLVKFFKRKWTWNEYWHYVKATIINMLFLLHPMILKFTMQMFSCTTIDDTQYLDVYMEDQCWTGDHWNYSLSVAIPSFVVWGIGLPVLAFSTIHRLYNNNKKLYKPRYTQVYGFLFLGYVPRKYWWELMILLRKVAILATLIWLSTISTVIQALVAQTLILFAIYIHHKNRPFRGRIINRLEFVSLIVSMVTLYVGLWYLSGDVGEEAKIILFIIMLIANWVFGVMWVIAYIGSAAWAEKIAKRFRAEQTYIKGEPIIPFVSKRDLKRKRIPGDKTKFLQNLLSGYDIYTSDVSAAQIGLFMNSKEHLMQNLFKKITDRYRPEIDSATAGKIALVNQENSRNRSEEGEFSFSIDPESKMSESFDYDVMETVLETESISEEPELTDLPAHRSHPPMRKN